MPSSGNMLDCDYPVGPPTVLIFTDYVMRA